MRKERDTKTVTDALCKSKYFLSASGCRNVTYNELTEIIEIILNSDNVEDDLKFLYSHHPDTVSMNRSFKEYNCENFYESCDCFLPDVDQNNIKCKREFKEKGDRNNPEYFKWRKSVFERDQYTCKKCGKSGGVLNAHHINSFKKYPDLRLNIENGITFCESCHKEVHRERN